MSKRKEKYLCQSCQKELPSEKLLFQRCKECHKSLIKHSLTQEDAYYMLLDSDLWKLCILKYRRIQKLLRKVKDFRTLKDQDIIDSLISIAMDNIIYKDCDFKQLLLVIETHYLIIDNLKVLFANNSEIEIWLNTITYYLSVLFKRHYKNR